MRGTPKTLEQAIDNALTNDESSLNLKEEIVKNVREYLAQQFDPFVMSTKPGSDLWDRISNNRSTQ